MSICKICRNHDKCKFDFKDTVNTCPFIYPEEIPIVHGKAELEEHDKKVRNKAIDEFVERLVTNVESFQAEVNGIRAYIMTEDYFHEYVMEMAEQMKVE